MNFDFNINILFPEEISLVTGHTNLHHAYKGRDSQKDLEHVINSMGVRSARAQNLPSPITSWLKLRVNSHKVYLLKETSANNGLGSVIGFIKIGRKQLFVLDREGIHNEMHPLCVLDFYVHESQQRRGHGLKLFKHMLQVEDVKPSHLAVDRPSTKFKLFLRKHFNLWATLPQVNNFAIFDGFFKNRNDAKRSGNRRGNEFLEESDIRPLSRAYSDDFIRRNRHTAYEHDGGLARPVSGSRFNGSGEPVSYARYQRQGQTARANMYSRFGMDENCPHAPLPQSRGRRNSRRDDDIITNPYRRITNLYSKKSSADTEDPVCDSKENDNLVLKQEESIANRDSDQRVKDAECADSLSDGNKPILQPIAGSRDNSGMTNTGGGNTTNGKWYQASQNQTSNDTSNDHCSASSEQSLHSNNNLGHTQAGHTDVLAKSKPSQYSTPSDMILELQQKDKSRIDYGVFNVANRNRNNPSVFGSSWNVMGVPSTPWAHAKNM